MAEPTDRCRFGSRKDTGWLEPSDQRQSGEMSEGMRAGHWRREEVDFMLSEVRRH